MITVTTAQAQTSTPVDPRLGCDKVEFAPTPNLGEPDNIDLFKKRLLYYRCTAYERDLAEVLGKAETWIKARAPQVERPAIVLDIDETSLSNWPRIYQDGYAYFSSFPGHSCNFAGPDDTCGDLDWQQKRLAKAIVPTLRLYRLARCIEQPQPCKEIDVFFVTGRRDKNFNDENSADWTLRNLDEAGYSGIARDHLYLRDANSIGPVSGHKTAARAEITRKGLTIIANIGDQKSDLDGGYAEMTFKLPNPFYFLE